MLINGTRTCLIYHHATLRTASTPHNNPLLLLHQIDEEVERVAAEANRCVDQSFVYLSFSRGSA